MNNLKLKLELKHNISNYFDKNNIKRYKRNEKYKDILNYGIQPLFSLKEYENYELCLCQKNDIEFLITIFADPDKDIDQFEVDITPLIDLVQNGVIRFDKQVFIISQGNIILFIDNSKNQLIYNGIKSKFNKIDIKNILNDRIFKEICKFL